MNRLFPSLTVTKTQAAAYLFGVALFSISFLVFLNSSVSFVITDVIGQKEGVGDAVGTLGFADELLALVACPLWGLLSDRLGVRIVAVTGFLIVGLSLICLVQAKNVYPELLLGRLAFSIGGAACSTMVTAILPAMTTEREPDTVAGEESSNDAQLTRRRQNVSQVDPSWRHSVTPSISSELTITPARYTSRSRSPTRPRNRRHPSGMASIAEEPAPASGSSQLAGFVGMFTGIGALLAVGLFLPLPARISENGTARSTAVKESFYIVGSIAIVVGLLLTYGLRNLPGETGKGFRSLVNSATLSQSKRDPEAASTSDAAKGAPSSYWQLIRSSLVLAFTDTNIGLGYLGGFVARASSVGISLFIPLFVNAYFIREGLCTDEPGEDIKSNCRRAYTVASMLTGVSQLVALLSAPLFGWLGGRMSKQRSHLPLAFATVAGVAGSTAFGLLHSPDPFRGHGDGRWAFLAVTLMGLGQIGSIVCSLGLLARGIQATSPTSLQPDGQPSTPEDSSSAPIQPSETAPLLASREAPAARHTPANRTHLKGTIAGVYSLAGGAGILLLTKLGGKLFDTTTPGAPFFILAGFNALLLFAVAAVMVAEGVKGRRSEDRGEET
ncbi:hypothetical protein H2203_001233 [Taxawa tesnikishii (nom. ined.)]|nr:hypothetical protein H2203_001233 [Dothideales sp. JES 119]